MVMITMMVTWLLFKVYQKNNQMTQDQKNKLKSIKKSLENVYEAVVKHVQSKDPRVLSLPDYGVILGTVQILLEDEIIKGTLVEQKAIEQRPVETEFAKPETLNKKPITFH